MTAENRLCTWLSKNLSEYTDNTLYGGHNISLDIIFKMAEAENVKDICSQTWLFQILKAMFPHIKKSKVKDNGFYRTSVKGLKFVTIDKEMVSFDKIDEFLPNDWNVLLKGDNQLNLCYLSAEKFNGNPIVKELSIMRNGLVQLSIAGKQIDLSLFFISRYLQFDVHSINGFFRCLKTIGLCHGAYLQHSEPDIFSSGRKCVKELYVIDNSSKFVIRHLECLRVVPISSLSSTCKKCSDHKNNKKQAKGNKRKTMSRSKEFVSSSESDSDCEMPKKKKAKVKKKEEKKETKKAASTGKSGEQSFQVPKKKKAKVKKKEEKKETKKAASTGKSGEQSFQVPKKKKAKVKKKEEKKETKKAASTGKSGEQSFQISQNRFVAVSEIRGKVMIWKRVL